MSYTYDLNVPELIPIDVRHFKVVHSSLPLDDSSMSLGTKVVKISRSEVRVPSLDCKERVTKVRNLNPLRGIYSLLTGLK